MNQSRRHILKLMAVAPLFITFGFAGEALARFAKPSMQAGGLFDAADQPQHVMLGGTLVKEDFPRPWSYLPFTSYMKFKVFNPQEEETRPILGFIIRLDDERIVAYSRECPRGKGRMMFWMDPGELCGCPNPSKGCCSVNVGNPVFICCCHGDVYDLARDGACIRGPSSLRPKQFEVTIQGEKIFIGRLDSSIR